MATLEQVEKLREKANVTYDEAKEALDSANGDMLDALIYLEKKGKVSEPDGGGYYSSEQKAPIIEVKASGDEKDCGGESFGDLMGRFGRFCLKILHKGMTNSFVVTKNGERKASVPVIVPVIMLLFMFWLTIPLLIVGLFFGLRYRFVGPDLEKESVNGAMDAVANTADKIKKSITENK
ncbi:MAG: ubiquitin [Bacillota bacterium]|nr:ubiquitin [Bacillota bacterium]